MKSISFQQLTHLSIHLTTRRLKIYKEMSNVSFVDHQYGDMPGIDEDIGAPATKKAKIVETASEPIKDPHDLGLTISTCYVRNPIDPIIVGSPPFFPSDDVYDFLDPNTPHDRVLLVGSVNLYVLEEILSAHSEFFKELFYKNCGQQNLKISDVILKNFIEFLSHIYPNSLDITAENVISLMFLSKKFQAKIIESKASSFMSDGDITSVDGPAVLNLLKMVLNDDSQWYFKDFLFDQLFERSQSATCKSCKESCRCPKEHRQFPGVYLNENHFLIKNKELIMKQEPKVITFVVRSLFGTYHKLNQHLEEDDDDITSESTQASDASDASDDSKTENCSRKTYEEIIDDALKDGDEKSFVGEFTNETREHDAVIIAEGVKHYVHAKVVCMNANWFNCRLFKGAELEVPDISSKRLCFFLANMYSFDVYERYRGEVLCVLLMQLSIRFESKSIFNTANKFLHRETITVWETAEDCQKLDIMELATNYDMSGIKKFIYEDYQKFNGAFVCWCGENVKCRSNDLIKEHKCQPGGIWIKDCGGGDCASLHYRSSEVHKFIISCVLGIPPV